MITLWYIGTSRKEEVSTCLPKFWCQLSFVAKNDPLLYWQIVTEPRKYCSRVNDELVLPGGGKKRQLNTERGEGFTKTRYSSLAEVIHRFDREKFCRPEENFQASISFQMTSGKESTCLSIRKVFFNFNPPESPKKVEPG